MAPSLSHSSRLLVVVGVLVGLLTSIMVAAAEEAAVEVAEPDIASKPVLQWSVQDVEEWMNHTIGYPEYSGYVRKYLIDGPTLVEMEPADFESFLPIDNPLQVIKIKAHVKLLRGLCSCRVDGDTAGQSGPHDFWSYMQAHSVRTFAEGTTALYFPRTAMLSAYFLDHELYLDMVGTARTQKELVSAAKKEDTAALSARRVKPWSAVVYWVSFLVAPDLYMAYQAARLVPSNYLLMPCFVLHFLFQAYNEYMLLFMIRRGTAFEPGLTLPKKIWVVFSYTLFLPLAGVVVGYVFPVFLQYLSVVALVIHNFLTIAGLLFLLIQGGLAGTAPGASAEEQAAGAEATTGSTGAAATEEPPRKEKESSEKID